MASSKEYLEFILGHLSELEEITYRPMGQAATTAGAAIVEVTALNLAIDNCQRIWRLYNA